MATRRILILTNRIPYPLKDGGNLAMKAMIDGYHKEGWQVYLLSMNTTRHYVPPETIAGIYQDIHAFERVTIDNEVNALPTILNYLFSRQPNHAVRFYKKIFVKKLTQVLEEFKPDVVQMESVFLTGYLPLIRQNSDALTVLRLHNIEHQVWRRLANETGGFLKKIYLENLSERIRHYEEKAWTQYDLLLPITEVDAAALHNFSDSILTVPFGIDTAKIELPKTTGHWTAYHIGAMDWLPNAEAISWFLKEVWPLIHKSFPQLRFYYAGRNMPEQFKNMQADGAICAGEVADADAFIADKNILIVPLRSGGGIRVKILEAMAAGKIVVSTDVGMQGINATPGEHYLAANEPQDFPEAIKWIYTNKEAAEMMAKKASTFIKLEYDERDIVNRLIQKIDNLLTSKD